MVVSDMDNILGMLVAAVLHGGPETIAVLILIIILLLFHIRHLTRELAKKDERLAKIVDDYYQGNITLAEALNSLRLVLYEIKIQIR